MLLPQLLYNGLVSFAIGAPLAFALYVRFQIYHLIDFGSGIAILAIGYLLTSHVLLLAHLSEVAGISAATACIFLLDVLYRVLSVRRVAPYRTMIVGLAALLMVQNLFELGFGGQPRGVSYSLSPIVIGSVVMQRSHLFAALSSGCVCGLLLLPPIRNALVVCKATADDPSLAKRWNIGYPARHAWLLFFCATAVWVFCRSFLLTRDFDPSVGMDSILRVITSVLISVNQSLVYLIACALCLAVGSELTAAFIGEAYRHLLSYSALCFYMFFSKQHAEVRR